MRYFLFSVYFPGKVRKINQNVVCCVAPIVVKVKDGLRFVITFVV